MGGIYTELLNVCRNQADLFVFVVPGSRGGGGDEGMELDCSSNENLLVFCDAVLRLHAAQTQLEVIKSSR